MSKVRFGDVVKDIKNNVDRNNNPYEFYVAGNHMDTEDLKIHRKGKFATDDVGPAFIREFKEGQVLYGSRRTYLKKVAVADFDGVTANTTFVLETSDKSKFLQELLPFIMLSDRFTQWSIMKSKGSTNPYVLFSDLAEYEFELPDFEKQRELAKLLWAIDATKKAYQKMLQKTDELVKSQFIEEVERCFNEGRHKPLNDLIQQDRSITYGILKPGTGIAGGVPVVKVKDFPNGYINESDLLLTSPEIDANYKRSKLIPGDLLISIRGTVGRLAEVPETLKGANITQDTARLSIKPEYNRVFIRGVLETPILQQIVQELIRGVAVKGINIGDVRKLPIPCPTIAAQDRLAEIYKQADKSKLELEQALAELDATCKSIILENIE